MKNNWSEVLKLAVAIIICEAAGFIGSIFTIPAIPTWYAQLNKPDFTPPSWLFGPVWTTLYAFMGIALYLVWRQGLSKPYVRIAILVFFVQLIFNVLWSVVFFGLKSTIGGMIVISFLLVIIAVNMLLFFRVSKTAGALLIPYILWVSFAAVLNYYFVRLN